MCNFEDVDLKVREMTILCLSGSKERSLEYRDDLCVPSIEDTKLMSRANFGCYTKDSQVCESGHIH